MSRRPLEDIRPIGPFFKVEEGEELEQASSQVKFESISDLPDSPMLEQYVQSIKQKTGKSEVEVINSQPVEDYMKRLGVWSQVEDGN